MRGMTETVTVWHKTQPADKDVWERIIVPGCEWSAKPVRTVSGNTAALASVFAVLLPAFMAGRVGLGDLVAKGEHDVEITGVSPSTVAQVRTSLLPYAFTVKTTQDGTAAYKRGKHVKIEGV